MDQKFLQLVCGWPESKATACLGVISPSVLAFSIRWLVLHRDSFYRSLCSASSCFIHIVTQLLTYLPVCAQYLFVQGYTWSAHSSTGNILHPLSPEPQVTHGRQGWDFLKLCNRSKVLVAERGCYDYLV